MRTKALFTSLGLTLLAVGGCGSDAPPAPADVRSHISTDLGNVLHEAVAASDGVSKMLPSGSLDLLERALGQSSSSAGTAVTKLLDDASDTGIDTNAIIDELNQKVFTDENEVEPGIYEVPGSLFCTETLFDENGNETESVDQECVNNFAKLDARVRVEDDGSTLTFAIQLDANHDEPLEVALSHTSLSLTVDLDAASAAAIAIATAFGEEAPTAQLAGQVTASLDISGPARARFAFDIDRNVFVSVDDFSFSSVAAHVLALELDGGAPSAVATIALGATTAHIPDDDGAFELDLPGATAQATFGGGGGLQIDNISLGDHTTTLHRNGALAFGIDLNPFDGRSLSVTAMGDVVSVSPRLDLHLQRDHAVLGDERGAYDVTRVQLEGSLLQDDLSDQVRVDGTFAITTDPASYGFSATAGQCVTSEDVYDDTTFESYTQWTAGACN